MPDSTDVSVPPHLDNEEIVQVVLAILLERHPTLVAFKELVAEFSGPNTEQELPASVIHDAIDELARLGLAHRLDRFVFASHAAVRARALGA